jgi:hypothetical protein
MQIIRPLCRFGFETSFFIDGGGAAAPSLSSFQQQQQQQEQQPITRCEVWTCDDHYEPTDEERKLKGVGGSAVDSSEAVKFLKQVILAATTGHTIQPCHTLRRISCVGHHEPT